MLGNWLTVALFAAKTLPVPPPPVHIATGLPQVPHIELDAQALGLLSPGGQAQPTLTLGFRSPVLPGLSFGLAMEPPRVAPPHLRDLMTPNGLQVTQGRYGLFLGKLRTPRSKLFLFYDQQQYRRVLEGKELSPDRGGRHIGVRGTLFLSRDFGLHFESKLGAAWSVGLSLVWRPSRFPF